MLYTVLLKMLTKKKRAVNKKYIFWKLAILYILYAVDSFILYNKDEFFLISKNEVLKFKCYTNV